MYIIKFEVIAIHDIEGNIRPYRIKLIEEGEYKVINIKRLLHTNKTKEVTGFRCEIVVNTIKCI